MALIAASQLPAAPLLAVMVFGVLVAIAGHIVKARWLAATGIALVFVSTAALFLGGYMAYSDDPDADPRQERVYQEPAF